MSVDEMRERNRRFAAAGRHVGVPLMPRLNVFVVTCLDPRTDPAAVLGLEPGDAAVVRNAGGRVTDRVLRDLAFISAMVEGALADRPLFEIAVVHHTECGTGWLAVDDFRRDYADRIGADERALVAEAVTDPEATVAADVERIRTSPWLSPRITVSGHVYDIASGLLRTVVAATPVRGVGAPAAALRTA